VKEERNLEDYTFQVVSILTLFRKPSWYEHHLIVLASARREPSGNGDFNAGFSGVNTPSKNIVINLLIL
jgi:hypothetical protein